MSTAQCRPLLATYRYAQRRPIRAIVLGGPRDVFGNGIHLNVIEAADDPAAESWRNINAINDLVEAILTTTDRLTVAALAGNAAAGGLMLALAADEVWCRAGAVLNPHYRLMGLHGSEYWTYTLRRRVGAEQAARLTDACLPVSPASALRCGLVDQVIGAGLPPTAFRWPPGPSSWPAARTIHRGSPPRRSSWPWPPRFSLSTSTARRSWPRCTGTSTTRASHTPSCATPSFTSSGQRGRRRTSPAPGPDRPLPFGAVPRARNARGRRAVTGRDRLRRPPAHDGSSRRRSLSWRKMSL